MKYLMCVIATLGVCALLTDLEDINKSIKSLNASQDSYQAFFQKKIEHKKTVREAYIREHSIPEEVK